MSRPEMEGGAGVRLDLLIARYGPMPEDMVRALGAVSARALAAQHALGRGHQVIDPVHIEVFADGPRLVTPESDAVTVPLAAPNAATDDIAALARVLVFAASGGPAQPEQLPVSPELRELLRACLSEDRRPGLDELARLLDGPPPARWLPDEPATPRALPADPTAPDKSPLPQPGPPVPPPNYSASQRFLGPTSSSESRTARLPWIIAAACWALILVVSAGTAVALANRANSGPPTYNAQSIGNACELIDLPALERAGGKAEKPPENSVDDYPEFRSLSCNGSLADGRLTVGVYIAQPGTDFVAGYYRSGKAVTTGTTGEGVTSGTKKGIGEDAYFSTRLTKSIFLGCEFAFIDGNLTFRVDVSLSDDPGLDRNALAALCEHQARTAWERLR
ncbi:hypothetical protein [Nocardia asiatica]|uniref:hypothetical protein n=1 Tax=Nocardia asiatica TaxID=209252 RepID=UPI003EDEC806